MTFQLTRSGDSLRARFSGILTFHDHRAGDELVSDVAARVERERVAEVRFDLSEVEALDSHWLGVFVRVLRRLRETGGRLVIERPQPDVRRLFAMVELDRVIEITG